MRQHACRDATRDESMAMADIVFCLYDDVGLLGSAGDVSSWNTFFLIDVTYGLAKHFNCAGDNGGRCPRRLARAAVVEEWSSKRLMWRLPRLFEK